MTPETSGEQDVPAEAAAFLAYWFETLTSKQWWKRDPKLDADLRERFGVLYRRLSEDVPAAWLATPRGTLAAVMVLDQLPRNLFRDDPRAFATDAKARALAESALERGLDRALGNDERIFLYVPFQHSEDRADQARSVALYERLGDDSALEFACKHKAVIDRFGRFPHRNHVLGRESTAEEIEFLEGPSLFW